MKGTYTSLGINNFEDDDDDYEMTGVDQIFINYDKMINTNCTREDKQKILEENKIKLLGLEEEKKLIKKNKKFSKD